MTASNSKARSGALGRLATALGTTSEDLAAVAPLGDRDLDRLTGIVTGALERDEQRVAAALEGTVRFVPRPLRGRARNMLFPEDEPTNEPRNEQ